MAANTTPIFPIAPKVSSVGMTLSNFAKNGIVAFGATPYGSSFYSVYTAGANGSRIDQIKVRSLGPNSATTLRLFVGDTAFTYNNLIHETTLAAQGTVGSAVTLTAQGINTSGSTFTSSGAHGLSVGQFVYFTSIGTFTAVTNNTGYYVASVPSTTTFTLVSLNGTYVNPTSYVSSSATIYPYTNFETAATTDFDITITKNTTETACPIPYIGANTKIIATISNIGSTFVNTGGWQITVHGGDY